MTDRSEKVKPLPVLIGPRNCEACTGLPWRSVRDNARAMGVPVLLVGRKAAVPAAALLAALERQDVTGDSERDAPPALPSIAPTDPAQHIRATLGLRLKAGGR